jgi:hypothetical protein
MPYTVGMRKVVINGCFGGFSLSPEGVARLAELQGRSCYFFDKPLLRGGGGFSETYVPLTMDEAKNEFWAYAFDIPNPNEVLIQGDWKKLTAAERQAQNDAYAAHVLDSRPAKRDDPLLVQVVEELGKKASGSCADLRVVEIPSGVEYVIEEYDGNEHIAEAHRTWS